MDLQSIINTEASEASAPSQALPITPAQTESQQASRDYNYQAQPPGNLHPSHDNGGGSYVSPASYQGGYQGRPAAPPSLAPPSQNDLRSPVTFSQYSAQSPYTRHTPSSSMSGQYPFPQSNAPQSPAQPLQYTNALQQRESYPQSSAPPPHLQHHASYSHPSPIPNTPPVGTPGGSHTYYQHQRSQSTQSTSTPTSAQSQHYFHHYPQDSPISTSSFPHAQLPQHQTQQSQPGTPLGPPISNPRQTSSGYPQPSSPYQRRPQSSGALNPIYSNVYQSPVQSHSPQLNRSSTTPGAYGQHLESIGERSMRSQSSRERSISISPKTQIAVLPLTSESLPILEPVAPSLITENGISQAIKRKMKDRVVSEPPQDNQHKNGDVPESEPASTSPQLPAPKRRRYGEKPIWARSAIGRVKHNGALLPSKRQVNGKQYAKAAPFSSINIKSTPTVNGQPAHPAIPGPVVKESRPEQRGYGLLGPWEPSITGSKPYEEVSKLVADFLFMHVVNRPDAMELSSRGVEIEIEAKLGQLINKDTSERCRFPVQSECILLNNGRVSFKSSMTEAQHKTLNDFLNKKVSETHPENPINKTIARVPIIYAHKHERDRFYELPPAAIVNLPMSIREQLNPRHTVKVRVTHDQKTGQQLAKIIKARVADLDLYNPRFPLDCRISVNLEMRYDGDIDSLVLSSEASSRIPDRNKDRLSYAQSHYQIDLTQVTVADPNSRTEKEHELEIEISSKAVRDQGLRARNNEPHKYSELIEGLMDNVRVLSRTVPSEDAVL